jgi:hypothetical protein
MSCSNNERQLALAIANYESAFKRFPPSVVIDFAAPLAVNNGSWGVHGRILPYIEATNLYQQIDLTRAWDAQMSIDNVVVPLFQCPSDPKAAEIRDPGLGRPRLSPTNYGFSFGPWFVFEPASKRGGEGVFFPNSFLRMASITDGTSSTLLLSEVKAWQPYYRNGGPPNGSIPPTINDAVAYATSGSEFKNTGHTEWPDGRVHHTGFTATFPPNSRVQTMISGKLTDIDYNSFQEGKNGAQGLPTYAMILSRSHHGSLVLSALCDGSVRSISNSIDQGIWRALSTRSGGEITTMEE